MNIHVAFNCFSKIGLSPHDLLLLIAILETGWWLMFSLSDGADALLQLDGTFENVYEEHEFNTIQKYVSASRLILTVALIWYGTILRGKALPLQIYFVVGILVDLGLILTLVIIGIEENYIYTSEYNIVVVQYVLTFVFLRLFVYSLIFYSAREIFVSPFATPAVGTVNGEVVGIPDQTNRAMNSGNNVKFIGKGMMALLEYYRYDPEQACLLSLAWDVIWNLSIILTQELPEMLYQDVMVGLFASLPIILPTEIISFRCLRVFIGCLGIFLVKKKLAYYLKLWIVASFIIIVINATLASVFIVLEPGTDTNTATFVICSSFMATHLFKLLILYCSIRFYIFLKRGDLPLINEDNNNAEN